MTEHRRFPPLAYVYFEEKPGRRSAAKLLTKDEARRIAANVAKLQSLIGIRAARSNRRVQSRRGLICIILHTKPADAPDSGHALLEADETAIRGLIAHVVHRAPRIILGFGACPYCSRSDVCSECEHQNLHGRPL
jgi:hypothetical protein